MDVRARTPETVKVKRVVRVQTLRGRGTEDDRLRTVTQWWSFKGKLLGEDDPCAASSLADIEPALNAAEQECRAYDQDDHKIPAEVWTLIDKLREAIKQEKEDV